MTNTKTNLFRQSCALLLALFFAFSGFVGLVDFTVESEAASSTVENYYANLDDNCDGKEFRANLAELITNTHKTLTTYKGLGEVYKTTDADPDKPGNIILFYTGKSVSFSGNFSSGVNREHVWPKNGGSAFPEDKGPGADAHHLRPCDSSLNSTRGNHSFGEVPQTTANIAGENGTYFDSTNLCYQASTSDGTLFYPGEGYRGATARILMYMQVRWGDQYNLKFVDSAGNNKTIGKISDLMKWHLEEPPTEEEIRRNEAVFKIQGNRNPFIDHPEYAEKIFCYDGESYNAKLQSIVEQYGSNYEQPEITGISLSPSTLTLPVGQSATLTASVQPANAAKRLTWTSSNPTVATVENGKVTALQAGTVTVTVSSTDNPDIKATATVNVKAVTGITVSGTPTKTTYYEGETFSPTGLVVTLHHTDGSTATANLADCAWLDGKTGAATLSVGSTSVTCKYGNFTYTINGITVNEPVGQSVTVTRDNFSNGSSYGWYEWNAGSISGQSYVYPGNKEAIQMNTNDRPSYYLFNSTPLPGGLVSITIKMQEGKDPRDWEILTSSTPYSAGVSKYPTTGTSHGKKTATAEGVTWTINTSDPYFTINYMGKGAAYVSEIIVTYGGSGSTPEHTFGAWQAEVPATCEAEGTKGHYFCSHCNGYFDADENPMTGIVIPKKDHTFGEWVTTKPATQTQTGEMQRECSGCHTVETEEIPVLPPVSEHTFSAWQAEVPATCKAEGTRGHYFCSHCNGYFDADGNALNSIVIPKTEHSFGVWVVTKPATETEKGEQQRECSACHEIETNEIPMVGASAFKQMVDAIKISSGSEEEFNALCEAFRFYETLSADEKAQDATSYAKLQAWANAYNIFANKANQTMDQAVSLAAGQFSVTAISLGAILWLIAKKFMIGG